MSNDSPLPWSVIAVSTSSINFKEHWLVDTSSDCSKPFSSSEESSSSMYMLYELVGNVMGSSTLLTLALVSSLSSLIESAS